MAPSRHLKYPRKGLERVRDQILTALHFDKLRPGDRAPSVRRLADLTGMNRKTVHRAYRRLAREGLLDLRPGSGTFISEANGRASTDPTTSDLMVAINRCRSEAARLGVPPKVFSDFLHNFLGDGLRDLPLAVVECNEEQVSLIVEDLRIGLHVDVQPVLLRELSVRPRQTLGESWGVVTTDCHWSEVVSTVDPLELPVYRVALDATFPQVLAQHARHGPVVMVVHDRSFAPVFLRLLRQISVPEEHVERFCFVLPGEARAEMRKMGTDASVYISPLVNDGLAGQLAHFRRIQARWHVAAGAVDQLRARLSLDAALRRHAEA